MPRSLFRLAAASSFVLAGVGPGHACDMLGLEQRLLAADEHLFWSEFWYDVDAQEAKAELGYCAAELRQAIRLAQDPDCDNVRRSAVLGQTASRRLTSIRLALTRMTSREFADRR